MTRAAASVASIALVVMLAVASCARPGTVDIPSPSPYAAPASASPSSAPSIYSPAPESPGRSADPSVEPSQRPTASPSPDPTEGDEPRPGADIAGIRCGDAEEMKVNSTKVVTRTTCYPIRGTSMAQLDAQMHQKGPRADGQHAIAVTRWLVRWSYEAQPTTSGCELGAPSVQTVAVYRFPTWDPPSSVAEATIEEYRAFMQQVRAHEGHHRALAVDAGVAIRRALLALPPAGTCAMLEKKADDTFDTVFARYEARQKAFDEAAGGISY